MVSASEQPSQEALVPLGYFWGGETILYPELLDLNAKDDGSLAADYIRGKALLAMAGMIDRFNKHYKASAKRLDFTHPAVVTLQHEAAQLLDTDRIGELLHNYHAWKDKPDAPHKPLYADEFTRADVCLLTHHLASGRANEPRLADNTIAVRVHGAYHEITNQGASVKFREPTTYILVAERRPFMLTAEEKQSGFIEDEDYTVPHFEEGFAVLNDLIEWRDLEDYVGLAQRIRDVADGFKAHALTFNKENLGVYVTPTTAYS